MFAYKHGQGAAAGKASSDSYGTRYSMYLFLPDERHRIANILDATTAGLEYLPVQHHSYIPKTAATAAKFEINLNLDLHLLGLMLLFSHDLPDVPETDCALSSLQCGRRREQS